MLKNQHLQATAVALVRYAWASPNTLLGLLFMPLTLARGNRHVIDGVLELHSPAIAWLLRRCVPLPGGAAAMTFGHVVIGSDARTLRLTRDHERAHVRQYETWGPFFIPAYFVASLWAWMTGGAAYADNYFERQAHDAEAQRCATES